MSLDNVANHLGNPTPRGRAAAQTQHGPIANDVPDYVRRMQEDWPLPIMTAKLNLSD
jgi:hypothetical protein